MIVLYREIMMLWLRACYGETGAYTHEKIKKT